MSSLEPIQIEVPTLRNEQLHREWLFRLENQLRRPRLFVEFSFTDCKDLRQSAVAFLGAVARLVESLDGVVAFNWSSCSRKVLKTLQQNRFTEIFGGPQSASAGHSVPYREDRTQESGNAIAQYLQSNWLGRGWMNISPLLTAAIVGRVLEIYLNAFEHGNSAVGVITCGHHYENSRELGLTVVDLGVGIPFNVREYLGLRGQAVKAVPAQLLLQWAFQRGNTTKRGETSRGIGLDLLKEFVKLNGGRLEFYSHDAQATVTKQSESFTGLPVWFHGTMVTITFQCDDLRYQFQDEVIGPQQKLF